MTLFNAVVHGGVCAAAALSGTFRSHAITSPMRATAGPRPRVPNVALAPPTIAQTALAASKKEKEREGERKVRLAALEDRRRREARRELESSLRAQLMRAATAKSGGVAKAVRRLLRNAEHEGLRDVGDEARALAVRALVAVGHLGEAVPLLADLASFDQYLEMGRHGLKANAAMERWDAAAGYAESIFDGAELKIEDVASPDDDGATAIDDNELRSLAIQSYANADRNLDVALEMSRHAATERQLMPPETNAILRAMIRSRRHEEARAAYQSYVLAGDERTCADTETHRLALSIAAELADARLAEEGMRRLRLRSKPAPDDIVTALRACCRLSEDTKEDLSFSTDKDLDLAFVKSLVEEFKLGGRKVFEVAGDKVPPEVFSLLLTHLDDDNSADLLEVIEASKSVKTSVVWPKWLNAEARIRAIPALERHPDPGRREDALALLRSLALAPDDVCAATSNDFWSAALRLCATDPRSFDLAVGIVRERHLALNDDVPTVAARSSVMMKLVALDGQIDEVESIYTDTKEKYDLSDLALFQLMQSRFFSLLKAYAVNGEMDAVYEILFPTTMGREVLEIPSMGGLIKGAPKASDVMDSEGSFLSDTKAEEQTMLQALLEQVITCDESTGALAITPIKLFFSDYYEAIASLWCNYQALTEFFAFSFGSPADSITDALWGEECRRVLLEVIIQRDCAKSWVDQAAADPALLGLCICALYTSPVFEYEGLKGQCKSVRKTCIKRIVDLLFESQFAQTRASSRSTKKMDRFDDFNTWAEVATDISCNLDMTNLIFLDYRDQFRDAKFTVTKVLLEQPVVKSFDKSVLKKEMLSRSFEKGTKKIWSVLGNNG